MNVADLMTTPVMSCSYDDDAQRAAQIMWDNDCGALPVLDEQGHLAGMITDRDICMAAYTRGQALWQIPVSAVMTAHVHRVHESDTLEAAERVMKDARVRRVPVLDGGGKLAGILSMNDLARNARHASGRAHKADGLSSESIMQTLAAIREPRGANGATTRV